MATKPKILICTTTPEGVSSYFKEKFKDWEIVEVNTSLTDQLQGMSFDTVWIDELVRHTPMIVDTPIDNPEKAGKLPKQRHVQPFWTNNWRK